MTITTNRLASKTLALFLALGILCTASPSQQQTDYTFHATSDLVLVNVTVKDKSGKFVEGLKPEDFTILEDNKPQKVTSFDIENVDAVPSPDVTQAKPLPGAEPAPTPAPSPADAANQFKDRRLIVLFFDLPERRPDKIQHPLTCGKIYHDKQRAPADLVSIVSLGSSLLVNQDFTSE